jgi:hypothetical protein
MTLPRSCCLGWGGVQTDLGDRQLSGVQTDLGDRQLSDVQTDLGDRQLSDVQTSPLGRRHHDALSPTAKSAKPGKATSTVEVPHISARG